MFTKTILLITLAGSALSSPAPQLTTDSALATTTALPSGDPALSSELASLSSLEGFYSGIPSLPASVESYIETAFPSTFTDACVTTIPDYLATAPGYVKSALTSYEIALSSWYVAHSTGLSVDTSYTYTGTTGTYLPTGTCGGGVTATGKTSATTKATTKATGTGSAATGTATTKGSNSTATGTAATSTGSSAAAPRNGGVLLSFASVFGVLGFMAVL